MIRVDYVYSEYDKSFDHTSAFQNFVFPVNTIVYEKQGYWSEVTALPSAFIYDDEVLIRSIEGRRIFQEDLLFRIGNTLFVDFSLSTPTPTVNIAFSVIPIIRDYLGNEIAGVPVEFTIEAEGITSVFNQNSGTGVEVLVDQPVTLNVASFSEENIYRTEKRYVNKTTSFTVQGEGPA